MTKLTKNTGFRCVRCDASVAPVSNGGYRNHCPSCLHSLHVDIVPGDRASLCRGLMAPVALEYAAKKGFQIVHRCLGCGQHKRNRAAVDTVQPDQLIGFMRRMAEAGLGGGAPRDGPAVDEADGEVGLPPRLFQPRLKRSK